MYMFYAQRPRGRCYHSSNNHDYSEPIHLD